MTLHLALRSCALIGTWSLLGCAGKVSDAFSTNSGSGGQGGEAVVAKGGSGGQGGEAVVAKGGSGSGGQGGAAVVINGGSGPNDGPLAASAWDVTVSAAWVDPGSSGDVPQFSMTLDVLDEGGALSGILSRDGRVSNFDFIRESAGRAHMEAPLSGVRFPLPSDQGYLTALIFQTLTLSAVDDDSDGVTDRLIGSGDGAIEESCGDCWYTSAVSFSLSGSHDKTPPHLNLSSDALNPVDGLAISTSEALKSATLSLSGTSTVPLVASDDSTPITLLGAAEVLPFSGTWKVSGAGQDFANLRLNLSTAKLDTLPDPGVFAEDGFETMPNIAVSGDVAWVDADGGLPIPSGQHALLLSPGSSATFHLKRTTPSTKTVSALLVDLGNADTDSTFARVNAAVVRGTERAESYPSSAEGTVPTMHPIWTQATEPSPFQLALKDEGDDVIVRITAHGCDSGNLCAPPGALLVDDLKLE